MGGEVGDEGREIVWARTGEGFKRTSPLTSNKLEATVVFKKAEVGVSDLGLNSQSAITVERRD